MKHALKLAAGAGAALFAALPAWAQDAAPTLDTGDTAWMIVATVLVFAMIVPGLALFYGGLVRTKNMASVMTQVIALASMAMLMWVMVGYGLAFGGDANAFISTGKFFLAGVTADSLSGTIPEYVFIAFQMTFSAITLALVVGGLVERTKFSGLMVFGAIWLVLVYYPLAHMAWYGSDAEGMSGLFFGWDALDFAGGTVVHINAGVSALVGALIVGKRTGFPTERMAPHSLTLTLVGTGLLWMGWFGFNAGSALGANGGAGLALLNTFVATAAGVLFWMLTERVLGHKSSLLGACSGAIAGLVAITPAAGNSGPFGAIILGAVASVICTIFVVVIKPKLKIDETLDAFGIHALGGIVGSIGTAFTMLPAIGGPGAADYALVPQLIVQVKATGIAIVWAAVGSAIAFTIAKAVTGLRVSPEVEQEGLDLGEHGERAYNY